MLKPATSIIKPRYPSLKQIKTNHETKLPTDLVLNDIFFKINFLKKQKKKQFESTWYDSLNTINRL